MPRGDPGKVLDFSKQQWINVGGEIGRLVNDYAAAHDITNPNEAARILFSIALSGDANAINDEARKRAYNESRKWVIQEAHTFFNELWRRLADQLKEASASEAATAIRTEEGSGDGDQG